MFYVILYTEKELLQMLFPEEEKIKSKYIFCDFEKAKKYERQVKNQAKIQPP